jgi:hypothetical protein
MSSQQFPLDRQRLAPNQAPNPYNQPAAPEPAYPNQPPNPENPVQGFPPNPFARPPWNPFAQNPLQGFEGLQNLPAKNPLQHPPGMSAWPFPGGFNQVPGYFNQAPGSAEAAAVAATSVAVAFFNYNQQQGGGPFNPQFNPNQDGFNSNPRPGGGYQNEMVAAYQRRSPERSPQSGNDSRPGGSSGSPYFGGAQDSGARSMPMDSSSSGREGGAMPQGLESLGQFLTRSQGMDLPGFGPPGMPRNPPWFGALNRPAPDALGARGLQPMGVQQQQQIAPPLSGQYPSLRMMPFPQQFGGGVNQPWPVALMQAPGGGAQFNHPAAGGNPFQPPGGYPNLNQMVQLSAQQGQLSGQQGQLSAQQGQLSGQQGQLLGQQRYNSFLGGGMPPVQNRGGGEGLVEQQPALRFNRTGPDLESGERNEEDLDLDLDLGLAPKPKGKMWK